MPIFNSLGSNYSWQDAWTGLRSLGSVDLEAKKWVTEELEKKYGGKIVFTYKGRDAICIGLRALGVGEGDVVLTQALACSAVESGIRRAGATPQYLDLKPHSLSIALPLTTKAKVLIVQHTFGYPDDLETITVWCKKHQVILVEDLAQSIGGEVGKYSDLVILSFGRDKVVDGVSGGAVIVKNSKIKIPSYKQISNSKLKTKIMWQDLTYPMLAMVVRNLHEIGVGKVIHKILTAFGWWYSPTLSPIDDAVLLDHYFPLIGQQLKKLDNSINHRRHIAKIYYDGLPKELRLVNFKQIESGACLRFPILVNNIDHLIKILAAKKIYLSDRWYRKPVDSGKIKFDSVYRVGSCPNAEEVAARIFNLPTHQYVTEEVAREIVNQLCHYQ